MTYRVRFLAPAQLSLLLFAPACGDDDASTRDASITPAAADAGSGGAGTSMGTSPGSAQGGGSDAGQATASAGGDASAPGAPDGAAPPAPLPSEDFVAQAADFTCLKDWTKVRAFRVANALGKLDAALAVANSPDGGTYPVGTILQLVPTEAMVKRGTGFSPETRDWEFFSLTVSAEGTQITTRGKGEVVNQFGLQCFGCHNKAAPQFDLVCETTHGCDPLPLSTSFLESLQDSDPRCR